MLTSTLSQRLPDPAAPGAARRSWLSKVLAVAATAVLCVTAHAAPPSGRNWNLVESDEFNGTAINTGIWKAGTTGWGSTNQNACSIIQPANSYLENGNLVLRVVKGTQPGSNGSTVPYGTGRVNTKNWRTYGYLEIRAAYPNNRGTWPAFWMLGSGWPPEFDIAEYFGAPRKQMGFHWTDGSWYGLSVNDTGNTFTGYRTYGLEWGPGFLKFYMDGNVVYSDSRASVPTQAMYAILSSGVNCGDVDGVGYPNYYRVDYFRWYQLAGGYYKFRNAATGLYVDGMGRTANGSACGQYAGGTSTNQQWSFVANGSYVQIRNRTTGMCLDSMGRTSNGSVVGQWGSGSTTNQQWLQEPNGNNFKFRNRGNGLYLNGAGSTANGSDLLMWSAANSNNLVWTVTNS